MSVKLHAMSCGTIEVSEWFLFREGSPKAMQIPVPAFLIDHPKGSVIFDTGLDKGLSGDTAGLTRSQRALKGDLDSVNSSVTIGPGENVGARLEQYDVDPTKVDFLINSHLHFDHCGGNIEIPNARMIVQKREWAAGISDEGKAANHYHAYGYDLGHDRIEVDGEHDLFGDGTVVCLPSYGHTPGHQSLRVRLDDGEVLITADACALCRSMDKMVVPGAAPDSCHEEMLATYRMFRSYEQKGAELVFGHDPSQWQNINSGPLAPLTATQVKAARRAMGR